MTAPTGQGDLNGLTLFANPFLACDSCGKRVEGAQNLDAPGPVINQPCGHRAGATSRCPSWGPVDGCLCPEHLGDPRHIAAPAVLS